MPDWIPILDEWRENGLGALIIGGRALVAHGLRDESQDLDVCISSQQCGRMVEWLSAKEREGREVRMVPNCGPLHSDWLQNGWFCHVWVDRHEFDFFGIPMRSPDSMLKRFRSDASDVRVATLDELGYLKRTGRAKDWEDVRRIALHLFDRGSGDQRWRHLFGDHLAEKLEACRRRERGYEIPPGSSLWAERPILRLGWEAAPDELRQMANAEMAFWVQAGALRREAIKRVGREFWNQHGGKIGSQLDFASAHQALQGAADAFLPRSPIRDPAGIIDRARAASGVNRWPGLIPTTGELVAAYFPAFRG